MKDLPEQLGIFSSIYKKSIEEHNDYFNSLYPPGKRLDRDVIKRRYNSSFLDGWRITTSLSDNIYTLDVLFSVYAPFDAPRIALVNPDYFLKWPHIEKNGLLCLKHSSDLTIHECSLTLTNYYLEEAKILIEKSQSGENRNDFISEFQNYWNNRTNENGANILLLPLILEKTVNLYYTELNKNHILMVSSHEEGYKWLEDCKLNYADKYLFNKSALFWLNKPIFPDEYPARNYNLNELIMNLGTEEFELLKSIVPNKPGKLPVIIGFETSNGNAVGGIWLSEPRIEKYKAQNIYPRFNGYRKGSKMSPHPLLFLKSSAPIYLSKVQNISRTWIKERGGIGMNSKLKQTNVCLIGCGSLGSGIARILTQSGFETITLIDDEALKWDNIGRHLLGAEFVGKSKVDGLKEFLQKQLPGCLNIKAEKNKWQELLLKNKTYFNNYNLIISTTGDWDGDDSLNYLFNTNLNIPVVYSWMEPFGIIGHTIGILEHGGCLACGFSKCGKFNYSISSWDGVNISKNEPACGVTYQNYGLTDILSIQAMTIKMSADIILGKIKVSTHRFWIGDVSEIPAIGGKIIDNSDYYKDKFISNAMKEISWPINPNCRYHHL